MFNFEKPPKYLLKRPPLARAIGQVKYPVLSTINTLETINNFQKHIENIFPYMHSLSGQQV